MYNIRKKFAQLLTLVRECEKIDKKYPIKYIGGETTLTKVVPIKEHMDSTKKLIIIHTFMNEFNIMFGILRIILICLAIKLDIFESIFLLLVGVLSIEFTLLSRFNFLRMAILCFFCLFL